MPTLYVAHRSEPVRCEEGTPLAELLKDVPGVLTARLGSRRVDLSYRVRTEDDGASVEALSFAEPLGNTDFQHSAAHLMAQAIKELWPDAKLTIGPPDVNGFFYDIDRDPPITSEEFPQIEDKMREIVGRDLPIRRKELSFAEARALFERRNEPYKLELLDQIERRGESASVYEQGDFVDLCVGPHVPSTGRIRAFKLLSVAGAYWKGDERSRQLSRIYGVAFPTEEALQAHLAMLAEAEKRDHRRIGKALGLFIFPDEAVPGMPLFGPKGGYVRMQLENYSREQHLKHGYQPVWTPHILRKDLWRISGHLDNYEENMYFIRSSDGQDYGVKPMNCPAHCLIFRSEGRSYRDLPLRFSELSPLYRQERSGTLHGLLRVRVVTQDDAHIFCTPDQVAAELDAAVAFVREVLADFGFWDRTQAVVSVKGPNQKVVGEPDLWARATDELTAAARRSGKPFRIEEDEAAFYGPKIDFKIEDAIGRIWQCSTIQLDFNMPRRFGLSYTGADGNKHIPVMIHRALFGSVERFLGILIEHYAGEFPVWLAPVQARVLTIGSDLQSYGADVLEALRAAGIRAELDGSSDTIGSKIRTAEIQKVPYMLVVGKREAATGRVAVRRKGKGDLGAKPVAEVMALIAEEIRRRGA